MLRKIIAIGFSCTSLLLLNSTHSEAAQDWRLAAISTYLQKQYSLSAAALSGITLVSASQIALDCPAGETCPPPAVGVDLVNYSIGDGQGEAIVYFNNVTGNVAQMAGGGIISETGIMSLGYTKTQADALLAGQ
jgi:hypothetical protein